MMNRVMKSNSITANSQVTQDNKISNVTIRNILLDDLGNMAKEYQNKVDEICTSTIDTKTKRNALSKLRNEIDIAFLKTQLSSTYPVEVSDAQLNQDCETINNVKIQIDHLINGAYAEQSLFVASNQSNDALSKSSTHSAPINNNQNNNATAIKTNQPNGLVNSNGANCFINSALQMVLNDKDMTEECKNHSNDDFANAFKKFHAEQNYVNLQQLTTIIRKDFVHKENGTSKNIQGSSLELLATILPDRFSLILPEYKNNQNTLTTKGVVFDTSMTQVNKSILSNAKSIIVHIGDAGGASGHYISYIKKSENGKDVWYLCNDSQITKIANTIESEIIAIRNSNHKRVAGYMC